MATTLSKGQQIGGLFSILGLLFLVRVVFPVGGTAGGWFSSESDEHHNNVRTSQLSWEQINSQRARQSRAELYVSLKIGFTEERTMFSLWIISGDLPL